MPGSRSCSSSSRPASSSGGSSSGRTSPLRVTSGGAASSRPGRRWPCPRAASGNGTRLRRVIVRELELDLDAFEGPFDLLLTLVLRQELELAEVDVAEIVLAFCERLEERGRLDLDACGEFLVLVAALLELKARGLFPEEALELSELEPEEAAEELARRLADYRRMKEAAAWLSERLEGESERFFRLSPAPLAPRVERELAPQEPERLGAALRLLAKEPLSLSLGHMALRFPPVSQFLERFRAVLRRRRRVEFESEVVGRYRGRGGARGAAARPLSRRHARAARGRLLKKTGGHFPFRSGLRAPPSKE